jgi:hypothetical protein
MIHASPTEGNCCLTPHGTVGKVMPQVRWVSSYFALPIDQGLTQEKLLRPFFLSIPVSKDIPRIRAALQRGSYAGCLRQKYRAKGKCTEMVRRP